MTVNKICKALSGSLKELLDNRSYFTNNSKLVKSGLIHLNEFQVGGDKNAIVDSLNGNFNKYVELDRRSVDFITNVETNPSDVLNGSHLYTPSCTMSEVKLP